jgi:opacity protein-like surface antigen
MKLRTLLLMSLATCGTASPAFATTHLTGGFPNSDPYVGASIGLLRYDAGVVPTVSPSAIVFRAGLPLNSFLAIEGRVGTGLSSDQADGHSVGLGTYWGAYAKGALGLTPRLSVYGVAGLASVSLNRNFAGDTTNTGLSVGVGGDYQLSQALALNFEWTYLPSPSQADSNLFSFGVNYSL